MILNPLAEVQTTRGADGAIDGLRIVAPVKGRGLQRTWISQETDPDRFARTRRAVLTALFDAQSGAEPWARTPLEERDLFVRSGLFVTTDAVSRPVACDYRLDEVRVACGEVTRYESFAFFRGNAVEHHRDPLTSGRSSTNLAFCFVAESFTGSLD